MSGHAVRPWFYDAAVRIASWNVNSLRARSEQVLAWLVDRDIDVALLQETKCTDVVFPFAELAELGYDAAHHGVDHWNGVAIISRVGLVDVERCFTSVTSDNPNEFDEPRLIAADCGGVRCWSVYVPNGRALDDPHFGYKLRWLDQLATEMSLQKVDERRLLVAGDFNVGRADIDFYDPVRWRGKKHATTEEREVLHAVLDLGFIDLARDRYPDDPMFTWWNYNASQFRRDRGLRIDLALVSPMLAEHVDDVWVDRPARDPLNCEPAKPSDHAPLIVDLHRW